MAGVQGRHSLVDPVPFVGSGSAHAGRKLASRRQSLGYVWYNASCGWENVERQVAVEKVNLYEKAGVLDRHHLDAGLGNRWRRAARSGH